MNRTAELQAEMAAQRAKVQRHHTKPSHPDNPEPAKPGMWIFGTVAFWLGPILAVFVPVVMIGDGNVEGAAEVIMGALVGLSLLAAGGFLVAVAKHNYRP